MILEQSQIDELVKVVEISLSNLYQNDLEIINRGGMEQAVSFRFGIYLLGECQQIDWLRDFDFDMEYNKNGNSPKKTPRRPRGTRPDLIIHTRNCNLSNILIVEIKGWWNLEDRNIDRIKLEDFTNQQGEYSYGLGVFLDLYKDGCEPHYIKDY